MITLGSFLVGGLVGFFAVLVVGFLFAYFKNCRAFIFLFQPFWKIFMFTFRNVLKCCFDSKPKSKHFNFKISKRNILEKSPGFFLLLLTRLSFESEG